MKQQYSYYVRQHNHLTRTCTPTITSVCINDGCGRVTHNAQIDHGCCAHLSTCYCRRVFVCAQMSARFWPARLCRVTVQPRTVLTANGAASDSLQLRTSSGISTSGQSWPIERSTWPLDVSYAAILSLCFYQQHSLHQWAIPPLCTQSVAEPHSRRQYLILSCLLLRSLCLPGYSVSLMLSI